VHGGLRRRCRASEQGQHFVLLDQPPGRFNALRRAIGVVQGEEFYLAPVDAALVVQHLEIGLADPADHAVKRAGPLCGTVWPSLISVVARRPGSYFFSAALTDEVEADARIVAIAVAQKSRLD